MDHIPHCGPHTIRVPYLGHQIWDGGDFLGYPERHGFRDGMPRHTWPREKILQLMQTWLVFSLVTNVMRLAEIEVRLEQFIEQDSQGRYLTTKALPAYSQALARYEENQEGSSKSRRLATISSYLEKGYQYVNMISALLRSKMDKQFAQSTGGPVMLSIGLTSFWLVQSCAAIYRDVGGSTLGLRGYVHASASFLEEKMITEGWCPSLTGRLQALGNLELQYVGYTHGSPDREPQDHSGCSTSVCSRSQINEATYQVRHTEEACGCELLEVDRVKMENIIRTGGTPVCRLIAPGAEEASTLSSETESDETKLHLASIRNPSHPGGRPIGFRLEVERASLERPYLAISHVWADGLGNNRKNGLPICELVPLQCRVSGAFPENQTLASPDLPSFNASWSKWFWIDTLCVPVQPESKHLRRQAITQMPHIYAAAEGVLVLDSGLLQPRGPEDNVQMMIRILLSSWYSRLWTMQESLLAKKVMIVFGPQTDHGQNLLIMLDDWAKVFGPEAQNERLLRGSALSGTCLALYQSLRNTGLLSMDNKTAHILRAVPHRAVSKREDEAICISTLLGLDLFRLLNHPMSGTDLSSGELADQRMITLLQMIQIVPLSILFAPGPRLQQPGFRWALKSFLHQAGSQPVFHDSPTAKVTSTGVECTCEGILLMSDVTQCTSFMVYVDGGPDIPILVATHPLNREYEDPVAVTPPGEERELVLIAPGTDQGGPAILAEILEQPATMPGAAMDSNIGVKKVRFLKLMGMSRMPAEQRLIAEMTDKAGYVTGGEVLGLQQKWLIT
ncbi:hypothetical protein PV04_08412 [Phialophora macrospora]|uniref:Heterokaryon incompatibility domain-containing protein n=1 Tax=Phialophora macrospora TaxID=1851006 RepID=A0A0D2DVP6_9EURO|nr:hypothetical protein PV04_08412 [Phialophora macrospora]